MNTNIPADIAEKFQAKYNWLQQKIGTLKGAIEPGIYRTPDGGWQCNYDGEWGYGCAITLSPGGDEPHEVHGEICKQWYREGGAFDENGKRGWLGYPTSDEDVYDSAGDSRDRISHFENGDIIYTEETHKVQTVKREGSGIQALNPQRQEIIEPLEALRCLVKRPGNGLADSRVKERERQIDLIERSICYDRYRVTVFGAFSAGKSTLLNALMGCDYLPSADIATTNIITEIFRSDRFYVFMPDSDITKAQINGLRDEVAEDVPAGTFLDGIERDGQSFPGVGIGFRKNSSKEFRRVISLLASEKSHDSGLSKFRKRIKKGKNLVLQLGIPNLPEWLGEITLTDAPGAGSPYELHENVIDGIIPKTQLVLYVVESPKAGSMVDVTLCKQIVNNCRRKVFFILNQIDRQNNDEINDALAELKEHIPSFKAASGDGTPPPRPEFLKTSALCEVIANRLSDGSLKVKDLESIDKLSLHKLAFSDEWVAARNDEERKDAAIRFLRERSQFDKLRERIRSYLHKENKELPFCEMAASFVKDCSQEMEDVCKTTIAAIRSDRSVKELEEKQGELRRRREEKASEARRVLADFRESVLTPETGVLSKAKSDLAAIPNAVTEDLERTLQGKSEFKRLTANKCEALKNWLLAKVSERTDPIYKSVNWKLNERGEKLLMRLRPIFEKIDEDTLNRQYSPVSEEAFDRPKVDEDADTTATTIAVGVAGGTITAVALSAAMGGSGLAGLAGSAGYGVLAGKLSMLGLGSVGLGLGPIIAIAAVVFGIIAFFLPDWLKNKIRDNIVTKTRPALTEEIVGDKKDSIFNRLKAKIEEFVNRYVDDYANKLNNALEDMDKQEKKIIADVAKAADDRQAKIKSLESFIEEVKGFEESSLQTLRELNAEKEPACG